MKLETLTPAQSITAALETEIPAQRLARVLSDALVAETVNRDGTRGPDTRSRLAAAELILAYRIGKPVERSESVAVSVNQVPDEDFRERVRRSPSLRAVLRKLLDDPA